MNTNAVSGVAGKIRMILPVILRITFCLAMWTLGVMSMSIAEAQTRERVVRVIPVDRARVENQQRSANPGHESWRRIPSEKITSDSLD